MPHRFTVTLQQRAQSSFWQARIFLAGEGGREHRWSTGIEIGRGAERRQSARVAQRAADEHAERLAAAVERGTAAITDSSIEAVAKRMLAAKEADGRRPRAVDTLSFYLDKHVVPYFSAARDVTTVRRADLEAFKRHLREKGLAPQTINNALTAIRQVLKHAWKIDELMESIPMVANVATDKTPKGRALTAEQVDQLLAAVDPRAVEAKHYLTLVANTGVRKSEALAIRWPWIDWERRLIIIPAPANKGGRPRPPVVINDAAIAVLRERLALQQQRVDPADDRVFREAKHDSARNSAAGRAKLGRVRTHDLRHTLGSLHVAAGATLTEVRDTLGHSTMAMVSHYQHGYLDRRQDVADRVQLGRKSDPGSDPGTRSKSGRIRSDQAKRPRRLPTANGKNSNK